MDSRFALSMEPHIDSFDDDSASSGLFNDESLVGVTGLPPQLVIDVGEDEFSPRAYVLRGAMRAWGAYGVGAAGNHNQNPPASSEDPMQTDEFGYLLFQDSGARIVGSPNENGSDTASDP